MGDSSSPARTARLDTLRQLTSDIGAQWNEVQNDDPVQGLVGFAREHQITQIVLGSSQRTRWQEWRGGGSIVRRIVRHSGEAGIDVHIIARRQPIGLAGDASDSLTDS
jgi:two-component system, OmpR family, sensor histidine kinase KdpD